MEERVIKNKRQQKEEGMKTIRIGLIGAGFAGRMHCECLQQIPGLVIRIDSVADINLLSAKTLAQEFSIPTYFADYQKILSNQEIDGVIIATPPSTHADLILEAVNYDKHIICEKPLTGFFGDPNDNQAGFTSKKEMYERVVESLHKLEIALSRTDKPLMYAENYIYSPNVQKAALLINQKKSRVLFMRGELTVLGSPSSFASYWNQTGGGPLLRIGCHPLGGILYLKDIEAKTTNSEIKVTSVIADIGLTGSHLSEYERRHLKANPIDVEDFGTLTITFSDGTKATIFANDNVLGGVNNYIEIFCNDATMRCNITPTNSLQTYYMDQTDLDGVVFSELLEHKTGWNEHFISEKIERGYIDQMKDFMECIAYGRKPKSNFRLASEVTKIIYAAYQSAEEGRRIYF